MMLPFGRSELDWVAEFEKGVSVGRTSIWRRTVSPSGSVQVPRMMTLPCAVMPPTAMAVTPSIRNCPSAAGAAGGLLTRTVKSGSPGGKSLHAEVAPIESIARWRHL